MEHKKPNLSYVELVEKLLNEAKKKKEKTKDKKKGHSKEKMADKDYDGDGEVETSKEEYFGSKDKAIKKNMAKKEIVSKKKKKQLDEGRFVGNEQMIYGGFPRIINVILTEENVSGSESNIIHLMHGWGGEPVPYDVSTEEGLIRALQHIQGVKTGMDAADSPSNISPSERAAMAHNSKFAERLEQMAKERKLKVTHQGIGGNWTMDYGQSK